MTAEKILVFILSQQPLFRQGLEHLLSTVERIEVLGSTRVDDGVLSTIDDMLPDVLIVDIDAPAESGLSIVREIRRSQSSIGIVGMTCNPNDAQLVQVLKAQVAALLNKETTIDQLVVTITQVANGEHPINESLTTSPEVAEQVLHEFQELSWRSDIEAVVSPLTPRETQILDYVAQGYLNKQIAIELDISEQTIKNHVTSILRKLNANARTEAVVIAIKQGLISIS